MVKIVLRFVVLTLRNFRKSEESVTFFFEVADQEIKPGPFHPYTNYSLLNLSNNATIIYLARICFEIQKIILVTRSCNGPDTRNLRSSPPPASPEGLFPPHSRWILRIDPVTRYPLRPSLTQSCEPRASPRVREECIDPRLYFDVLVHPASSSSWTFALISSTVYLPGMSSGREISILITWGSLDPLYTTYVCVLMRSSFTDRTTTFNLFYEASLSSSVQIGTFGTIVWVAFYCRVWVKGGILRC